MGGKERGGEDGVGMLVGAGSGSAMAIMRRLDDTNIPGDLRQEVHYNWDIVINVAFCVIMSCTIDVSKDSR